MLRIALLLPRRGTGRSAVRRKAKRDAKVKQTLLLCFTNPPWLMGQAAPGPGGRAVAWRSRSEFLVARWS